MLHIEHRKTIIRKAIAIMLLTDQTNDAFEAIRLAIRSFEKHNPKHSTLSSESIEKTRDEFFVVVNYMF